MAVLGHRRSFRTVWCKPRSTQWWEAVTSCLYGEDWWKANLRMSQNTFVIVCNEVQPYIQKQATCFRLPVSIEKSRYNSGNWLRTLSSEHYQNYLDYLDWGGLQLGQ